MSRLVGTGFTETPKCSQFCLEVLVQRINQLHLLAELMAMHLLPSCPPPPGRSARGAIPKREVKSEPRSVPSSLQVWPSWRRCRRFPLCPTEKHSPGVQRRRSKSLGGSPDARDSQAESSTSGSEGESGMGPRRSKRTTKGKPLDRFTATNVWAGFAQCKPESFAEVQKLPQAESSNWQKAMEKELSAMKSLGVSHSQLCQLTSRQ